MDAFDDFYISAYLKLDTERTELNPIPWSKIQMYADRQGLDRDMTDMFEYIISVMDKEYIAWQSEKIKPKKPAKNLGA